jgi:hypothetical protein
LDLADANAIDAADGAAKSGATVGFKMKKRSLKITHQPVGNLSAAAGSGLWTGGV